MERSREARRGSMAALNGGLSRRRQRTGGLRDSPEADGGMEMAETTRLRERAARKERDRDRERERSGRSKRRRGERMMLHDSNRDEGDDTSDDSVDEEDDEEDTVSATTAVRLLPPPPLPPNNPPSMAPSSAAHYHHHQQQNNNYHHLQQQQQQQQLLLLQRKSFPAKSPAVWKTDEMIGVQVPRKARSASTKRSSHEWLVSGSGGGAGAGAGGVGNGGGGGGVVDPSQIQRQASPSPSRMSPASTSQISPSSSNASVRKKMKPVIGSKQRPPKIAKQAFIQEEIEVAEVLFGMTRQFQGPLKQESDAVDSRDANAGFANESRSAASPPNTASPHPPSAQQSVLGPSESSSNPSSLPAAAAVAVKRKRPRFLKCEDESTVTTTPVSVAAASSTAASSAVKMEAEHQVKSEAALPKSEKKGESFAHENGGASVSGAAASEVAAATVVEKQDSDVKEKALLVPELKLSGGEPDKQDPPEKPKEAVAPAKEAPCNDLADLDTNRSKTTSTKITPASDGIREKFTIDLMAPPPGKFSPERDGSCNFDTGHAASATEIDMVSKLSTEKKEDKARKDEVSLQRKKVEELPSDEFNPKKQIVKERNLDLQLDLEQPDRDGPSCSKMQYDKLQTRPSEAEPKRDKAALPGSLPVPMTVAGWPGNFPSFGYVGQVPSLPAVVPMDANSRSSNMLQPPVLISPEPRPKRCATHCYIAKSIHCQQQLAKMGPFWPAAAGTAAPYGAKPYNLSLVPPAGAAALFGSQMQGMFSGRNMGSLQGSREIPMVTAISGNPSNEKILAGNNAIGDPAQRKEPVLQQAPQGTSAPNILHGPAFILPPLNQQQQAVVAAAAAASAASRAGATTSVAGVTSGPPASGASAASVASSKAGGSAPPVNLSFAGLRANEAHQYMAILQNNGYPFPIPPHVAGPPSYIGASPPQAMPFFNGSFYPSQMLHPSQLQSQQQQPKQQQAQGPQQPQHVQQGHQNTSASSVSSSSQKHQRQSSQHAPAAVVNGAAATSHDFLANSQRHQQQLLQQPRKQESEKGIEDNPSAADSRARQGQKNLYGYNLPMPPTHPLMSAAAASAALGRGGGGASAGHNEKQTVQQQQPPHPTMKVDLMTSQAMTMTMPFASLNGVAAAPGLDFSSVVQNHALFQSLPEAARHAINSQLTATLAAASAEAAQQKKTQHPVSEDRKGHPANSDNSRKDDRKMVASVKAPGNGLQHSFTFSKPDAASQVPSIRLDTVLDNSSKTLSLIPGQMHHSTSTPASSTAAVGAAINIPNSQQPQLMQNQKQQQQQQLQLQQLQQQQHMQMQQQLVSSRMKPSTLSSSPGAYTERLPAGSPGGKFPQTQAALPGFPPGSARAAMPFSVPVSTPISKNSNLPQQQMRASPSQQTQISFGVNSMKGAPSRAASNPPPSAAAASTAVVGSPQNSTSKGSGESLGVSTSAKPGQSTVTSPLPQQSSVKSSPSNSTQKSSSANNRSLPSILGQPQLSSAPTANTKSQQQQQQQQLQRQQLYFSPGYMQQSNAAAAAYYQKRPAEQAAQTQQQMLRPGSMGLLALSPSSQALTGAVTAADPAKSTAAANGVKGGMPQPGLLHAPGNPHAIMSATFPCMSMQPVSIKPATTDQKPAAEKPLECRTK
ncbi:protein TIME FOR COFFEE-like isoform X3 [Ananas comosus]|uniref:Protein TIME FOR COFFEE-like isoform X3 n=1 Tax=Ananas comosus TaxID=4615 RepID=A0A6P5FHP3_ANACO|nr:protein TIME FOR COFFEE-like isoform X3 [Ananas comosus]